MGLSYTSDSIKILEWWWFKWQKTRGIN
jgi:hypothetical protein